jgi:hypothetical protein
MIDSCTAFTGAICDYIYLDYQQQERYPKGGYLVISDLLKLFQSKEEHEEEIIELIFNNGLDLSTFATAFNRIESEHQSAGIELRNIENKGDGIFWARLSTAGNANKLKIYSDFMQTYEGD